MTSTEILLGLLCGTVVGTVFGLVMWAEPTAGRLARPYIIVIGSLPVFALAPIMIMWFGTGLLSKVVMAGFSTCLVSLVQAYEGARNVSADQLRLAKSFGGTRYRVLRKIVLPSALTWVLAGFRLNIGFAVIGAFIGEFVSSEKGLGHFILKSGGLYDVPRVFFGLILLAVLALMLTGVLALVERMWFPWCRVSAATEWK